jgi:hypothetical protein
MKDMADCLNATKAFVPTELVERMDMPWKGSILSERGKHKGYCCISTDH